MLRHQFGQNFVLRLDLLLQIVDPILLGGMVGSRFRLKGSRSILEELFLPAVEDRRLEAVLPFQTPAPTRSRSVASFRRATSPTGLGSSLRVRRGFLNRNSDRGTTHIPEWSARVPVG